jgi:hypothetical protein
MRRPSGSEPPDIRVDIDELVVDATPNIDPAAIASAVDERVAEATRGLTVPRVAPNARANRSRPAATIGGIAIGQAVAAAIAGRGPR